MEEVMRFFIKKMCINYIFHLVIAFIIVVLSAALYHVHVVARITFYGGIVYFMIPFVLYIKKLNLLKHFFETAEDLNQRDYKMIDTSVLTQENIYSYSFDQLVKMNYRDIQSVQHVDNIFEVARPGYRGNHKVIIKDGEQVIQMNVTNEKIAEKIMNFIATKNANVNLMNCHKETESVQLDALENWQVSGRF